MEKYYKALDLEPGASPEDIKKQYRKLAKQFHPDVNNGDDTKFKEINEAYQVLTGKSSSKQNQPNTPDIDLDFINFINNNMGGFNPFSGNGGYSFFNKERPPPEHDSQIRISLDITIDEIKKGNQYSIKYKKSKPCVKCSGKGGEEKNTCNVCKGVGQQVEYFKAENNIFTKFHTCSGCHGRGIIFKNMCSDCQGKGYSVSVEELKFKIQEEK